MTQSKLTYENKDNPVPIVNRKQQATAEDFNDIKSVVNINADDAEGRISNIEENQITGVEVYETFTSLPVIGTLLVSYKVSNDPTSSLNGYYHWNGAIYVKDADLVQNVIEESNTSEGVSGKAVVDYNTNSSIVNNFDSVDFVGSGSNWDLEIVSGSLNVQFQGLSKNNIAVSKSIPSGYQYFIFEWGTGDVIIADNATASNLLKVPSEYILIGRAYAQFNLFGMRCNYSINGIRNDFPESIQHYLTNNPSSFSILGSDALWSIDVPADTLNMEISGVIKNNTTTAIALGGGYEYIIGNIITGGIFVESNITTANDLLKDRSIYLLIGKVYPQFGLFDMRCNFNVNGIPNILNDDSGSIQKDFRDVHFEDVNHVISYGQSLSVGETEKVISTQTLAKYGNLISFGGSVLTNPNSGDYPGNLTSFDTLYEKTNTGVAPGALNETPVTGTCEKLYQEYFNGIGANKNIKILGSAPGEGATTISQLSKGSIYYTRVMDDVNAGKNVSTGLGLTYQVSSVIWTQGESDYVNGTTRAVYKSLLTQLMIDLNTDIKAITGQSNDIRFISYQTATIREFAVTPEIAVAQYELAIEDSNILEMATPMYFMHYKDGFHLIGEYSKLMGTYYGKTLSDNYINEKNKPLYPIGHIIKGNNIELTFDVPKSPLVFETIPVAEVITNQGFQVMDGVTDILTSISLDGNGTNLILSCSSDPTGATIRYGYQKGTITTLAGPAKLSMGYLRDSNGNSERIEIDGNIHKLDNWLPVLEYNL